MIYLDNGATSFHKPPGVYRAVLGAMERCANPGRGGYEASMEAAGIVYRCRVRAGELLHCDPGRVVFTSNCTHGLNIALGSLFGPGSRVVISGFEHNAVTRTLHLLGAKVTVAGRRLFDWENTLEEFETALRAGVDGAVFTHVSNVFGYILPVEELAALCRRYGVPFVVDCAQSAGILDVDFDGWGAAFAAMPGHKGLLGPQGTGILLCGSSWKPLMAGGTGSESENQEMPGDLPEGLEPGTLNVPGIAGLEAGMAWLERMGTDTLFYRAHEAAKHCVLMLRDRGFRAFYGPHQAGTVSFLAKGDCEALAQQLARRGIAVRAGLHCAPLAHESAGTLETGTVRVSFGHDAALSQVNALARAL